MLVAILTPARAFSDDIYAAVRSDDLERVKAIVKSDPRAVADKDEQEKTPLHYAAAKGEKEIAEVLLGAGADVNALDGHRRTPLHLAASNGSVELVEVLLAHGAQINAVDDADWTPMHTAVLEGQGQVVAILQKYGGIDQANPSEKREVAVPTEQSVTLDPMNSIIEMSKDGLFPEVRKLLEKDPDLALSRDEHGATALNYAAANGHTEVASVLIEYGADVDARDERGMTPLHWAAKENQVGMVEFLLSHRASPDAKDEFGQTALDIAKSQGSREIAHLLQEHLQTAGPIVGQGSVAKSRGPEAAHSLPQSLSMTASARKEATDWETATSGGTQQAYIDFFLAHPKSERLTVLTGGIGWSGDAGRDTQGNLTLGNIYVGGDTIKSVSTEEFVMLGLGRVTQQGDHTSMTFRRDQNGAYRSAKSAVVLIKDSYVLACFEIEGPDQTRVQVGSAPQTLCEDY
jgi:ankyrin repeat protein